MVGLGSKKGISIVSGILFLAITLTATVLIYQAATPVVEKIQDASIVENAREFMSDIDEIIRTVASEGKGSKRTVNIRIQEGTFKVNDTEDVILWEYETQSPLISPRTVQEFGNLKIGSNLDVSVEATNYSDMDAWKMSNEHLDVYIGRWGSISSFINMTANNITLALYNKDLDEWFNESGFLSFSVDDSAASQTGNGYIIAAKEGKYLPSGTVTARMNSTYLNYYINFTLESGADFLILETFT